MKMQLSGKRALVTGASSGIGRAFAVALASDDRHAVSGSSDLTLRWWDLDSGRCLTVFPCEEPVTTAALCWSPSEQCYRVVAGLADGGPGHRSGRTAPPVAFGHDTGVRDIHGGTRHGECGGSRDRCAGVHRDR